GAGATTADDLAAALGQEVIEGAALRVGEDGSQLGVRCREHASRRDRCGGRGRRRRRRTCRGRGCRWRRRRGGCAIESARRAAGRQENRESDDPEQSLHDLICLLELRGVSSRIRTSRIRTSWIQSWIQNLWWSWCGGRNLTARPPESWRLGGSQGRQ